MCLTTNYPFIVLKPVHADFIAGPIDDVEEDNAEIEETLAISIQNVLDATNSLLEMIEEEGINYVCFREEAVDLTTKVNEVLTKYQIPASMSWTYDGFGGYSVMMNYIQNDTEILPQITLFHLATELILTNANLEINEISRMMVNNILYQHDIPYALDRTATGVYEWVEC